MMRDKFCACVGIGVVLLALMWPTAARAQSGRFVAFGGGASFPAGSASEGMNTGWVTELMAGTVLPGGVLSLRTGLMYGRAGIGDEDADPGMQMMEPGTQKMLGAMAGLMAMPPQWNWDWVPYVFATAGVVNASYQGSMASFAWTGGAGTLLQLKPFDLYLEGRLLQARKNGGRGQMVSLTAGIRLTP